MFRKCFLLALALALLHVGVRPVLAASQESGDARRIAKVKAEIAKRGVGEKAAIKVKLRDKTEVKGYVYQAGEDSFVVADSKSGAKTTIAYHDVSQIKGKGFQRSRKSRLELGLGES